MSIAIQWFSLLFFVLASFGASAGGTMPLHPLDKEVVQTPTFLRHHPDVRWRLDGLSELERGNVRLAMAYFRRAARFGDKVSQGLIAEAYWLGRGTSKDRALGYAWMDLAAERGYTLLLGKREHYWSALSQTERARAIEVGLGIYAEYGDEAAIPRLQSKMAMGRRLMTGSRAGGGAGVRAIYPQGPSDSVQISAPVFQFVETSGRFGGGATTKIGTMRVSASGGREVSRMWSDQFWDTEQYLSWKARNMDGELDISGSVEVLPLRVVND